MLVRHVLKRLTLPLAHRAGLLRLARLLDARPRRLALNYHNVSGDVFAAHATHLAGQADVVSLDEFMARGDPAHGERPLVTLTVDDGYARFVDEIVPVLERHAFPASWFVPTAAVGSDEPAWFDRVHAAVLATPASRLTFQGRSWTLRDWNRDYVAIAAKILIKTSPPDAKEALISELLRATGEPPDEALAPYRIVTRAELQALDPALVTIGSHSHTHPEMSRLTPEQIDDEVRTSKRLLEEWLGREIVHFAFPTGDYDDRVIAALRSTGHRTAWTTEPRFVGSSDDVFRLPRIAVDDRADVATLAARMTPFVHKLGVVR